MQFRGSQDGVANFQLLPRGALTAASHGRMNSARNFKTNLDTNSNKNLHENTQRGILKQAEVLDENRVVLYKKGHQLGQGYYIVEISSNNAMLYLAAYDVETPESFLIELPEKRAQDILL